MKKYLLQSKINQMKTCQKSKLNKKIIYSLKKHKLNFHKNTKKIRIYQILKIRL